MTRVSYELGIRGRVADVADFTARMEKYGDYTATRRNKDEDTSYSRTAWSSYNSAEYKSRVAGWARGFSTIYPESEIDYTCQDWGRGERPSTEIYFGKYKSGEFLVGETLVTHQRTLEVLGSCDCSSYYYKRHPTWAPFGDCPIRLNPPTQWAIENIMEAHERIGTRK